MNKSSVVHFEMPYKNPKRVSKFYKSVFGWGMVDAGKTMGGYVIATTTQTDKKTTRPKTPGAINGGFYKWTKASKEPSVVIAVEDFDKTVANVKKAGGKLLGKPQNIQGIGLWVSFRDTEGNRVSILKPQM